MGKGGHEKKEGMVERESKMKRGEIGQGMNRKRARGSGKA